MKFHRNAYALAFVALLVVQSVAALSPPELQGGESRYSRLLKDPAERTKLANLAEMEESSILDTEIVSKYSLDPEPLVRYRCAESIARIQDPRGERYLLRLLDDYNEDVVLEAIFALGLIGDEEAVEPLRMKMVNGSLRVKKEAILALGRISKPSATALLVNLLRNFNPDIRALAAQSLASTGDSTAARQCFPLLDDPSPAVLASASYTIGRLGIGGNEDRLIELLQHKDKRVRLRAAEALGRLKCGKAVKFLKKLTKDKDRMVRIKAVEALGRIGNAKAADVIGHLLGNKDPYIEVLALRGIANAKEKSLFKKVAKLTSSKSPMVRRAALEAVVSTGGMKARDYIIQSIVHGTPHEAMTALELLGKLGNKDDINLMADTLLYGSNTLRREGAAIGIGNYESEKDLEEKIDIRGKETSAIGALLQCANDDDWVVASLCVESLAKVGRADDIARLSEIFKARNSRVDGDLRLALLDAVHSITGRTKSDTDAKDAVIELYKFSLGDPDPRVRKKGAGYLIEFGMSANPSPRSIWKRGELPWDSPPLPMGDTTVVIKTQRGDIKVRLFGDDAPGAVFALLDLARRGFYDGLTFHRVVPGFVIQGGDPRDDGWGDAGFFLRSQFNRHRYLKGTVGLAHAGKDTPGSQFFITQLPQPHLDGRYTVIGVVVEGLDVVDRIEEQDTFDIETQ